MESNLKIVYVYMTESLCCTLEIYVCVCTSSRVTLFVTSWTPWSIRLPCPLNFPGKKTRVGCYFPLQGIFLTQGSSLHFLCLLHWQADSLQLCHLRSLLKLIQCCKLCFKRKKISLSVGNDITTKQLYKEMIKEYAANTYRENSIKKCIKQLISKNTMSSRFCDVYGLLFEISNL